MGTKVLRSIPFATTGEIEQGNLFMFILHTYTAVLRNICGMTGGKPGNVFSDCITHAVGVYVRLRLMSNLPYSKHRILLPEFLISVFFDLGYWKLHRSRKPVTGNREPVSLPL